MQIVIEFFFSALGAVGLLVGYVWGRKRGRFEAFMEMAEMKDKEAPILWKRLEQPEGYESLITGPAQGGAREQTDELHSERGARNG